MQAKFEIKGLKKLNKELKKLPEDFRKKALNTSVRTAAKIGAERARELVPVESGFLKSGIIVSKQKEFSKWFSQYNVKIVKKKSRYAPIIEYGSVKQPAQPFMRVAYEQRKEAMVVTFGNKLRQQIDFFNRKINRMQK